MRRKYAEEAYLYGLTAYGNIPELKTAVFISRRYLSGVENP
ncbi:MAG: hypothetical protein U5L72_11760 [Bacteroidales bacterium]|nr:hypothetical protein [Bacteroidales bacterium]